MKKRLLGLSIALSVSLILLFLVAPVNHSSLAPTLNSPVLVADGNPGPPLPPPPPPGGNSMRPTDNGQFTLA